jgi:outer membrane protein insertion porin family
MASSAYEGRIVSEVRIVGLGLMDESTVRNMVRTGAGDPYNSSIAERDVSRLRRSGRFLTVDWSTEADGDRVRVVLRLAERPAVTDVRFAGNVKYKESDLLKQVALAPGDPIDLFAARQGQTEIASMYRNAGYGDVVITFDEEQLNTTGVLLYQIEEGPKVKITAIEFEGNETFPSERLRRLIVTKKALWPFRPGRFDSEIVEADAATVQRFHRDEGFLDSRVSYRTSFDTTGEKLTVTFTIEEGTRYRVKDIMLDGNSVLDDALLRSMITVQPGEFIRQSLMDESRRSMLEAYHHRGHIEATVSPDRVFASEEGLVDLTFTIAEGGSFTVGRVIVRGNETTKDKVVRRSLDMYPGDTFDLTATKKAEQSLVQTRIFANARVQPVGDDPEVRDVLMNVEEVQKAGDFIFGFGVTSNSGVVGTIVLDIPNFDIADTPRSFSEFVKLRSFRGAGQRFRLEASPGTDFQRFRIDFSDPYFLDRKINFGTSLFLYTRGRESYDERRVGTQVSFGKRIEEGRLKDWYREISLRLENIDVRDVDLFAPRDVRDVEGSNALTAGRFSLVRDRTDNRFLPSKGDRLFVSYEQAGLLGGDHFFGKIRADYAWHKTVYVDNQDRKGILSAKVEGGAILGDAPVFERFYAGGIGSLRGFEFRGVSPRDGLDDDPIGGDFMLLTGLEYSFPLFAENVRGIVFTDMGTVEDGLNLTTWRASAGVGVRFTIDFFGPVPFEFALAAPLSKDEDDETQVFSFFIGTTF